MSRLKRALNRAKYAAMGAAIGAALGGLWSRNAASTGGGVGALAGATYGEKRVDLDSFVEGIKEGDGPREVFARKAESDDD